MIKIEDGKIENLDTFVTAYKYGATVEITTALGSSEGPPIQRLSSTDYVVTKGEEAGTIKKYKITGCRLDNLGSLKKTMKRISRLINANFGPIHIDGSPRKGKCLDQLFITFTFKDSKVKGKEGAKIVYKQFKMFMQKFRRKFGDVIWLSVMEPTAQGRWHLHVLMRTIDEKPLFIKNETIEKMWGQGFTSTKRVKSSNVARYLSAYLSNLPIEDEEELIRSGKAPKKVIKGQRLKYYPRYVNILRHSKRINEPEKLKMPLGLVLGKYGLETEDPSYYTQFNQELKDGKIMSIETEYFDLSKIKEKKLKDAIKLINKTS